MTLYLNPLWTQSTLTVKGRTMKHMYNQTQFSSVSHTIVEYNNAHCIALQCYIVRCTLWPHHLDSHTTWIVTLTCTLHYSRTNLGGHMHTTLHNGDIQTYTHTHTCCQTTDVARGQYSIYCTSSHNLTHWQGTQHTHNTAQDAVEEALPCIYM